MSVPDPRIVEVAINFLRGSSSAIDFTYAFRNAMTLVIQSRTLDGAEIDLFDLLQRWEEAGWHDRPYVVDELRALCKTIAAAGGRPR